MFLKLTLASRFLLKQVLEVPESDADLYFFIIFSRVKTARNCAGSEKKAKKGDGLKMELLWCLWRCHDAVGGRPRFLQQRLVDVRDHSTTSDRRFDQHI